MLLSRAKARLFYLGLNYSRRKQPPPVPGRRRQILDSTLPFDKGIIGTAVHSTWEPVAGPGVGCTPNDIIHFTGPLGTRPWWFTIYSHLLLCWIPSQPLQGGVIHFVDAASVDAGHEHIGTASKAVSICARLFLNLFICLPLLSAANEISHRSNCALNIWFNMLRWVRSRNRWSPKARFSQSKDGKKMHVNQYSVIGHELVQVQSL